MYRLHEINDLFRTKQEKETLVSINLFICFIFDKMSKIFNSSNMYRNSHRNYKDKYIN